MGKLISARVVNLRPYATRVLDDIFDSFFSGIFFISCPIFKEEKSIHDVQGHFCKLSCGGTVGRTKVADTQVLVLSPVSVLNLRFQESSVFDDDPASFWRRKRSQVLNCLTSVNLLSQTW